MKEDKIRQVIVKLEKYNYVLNRYFNKKELTMIEYALKNLIDK